MTRLIAILAGLAATAAGHSYVIPAIADEGAIMLTNGEVFAGQLHRDSDDWIVTQPTGSVRLSPHQVRFVGRDVAELHRHWDRVLDKRSAAEQLTIADWCLQQKLLVDAKKHLDAATALNPEHPALANLQLRLEHFQKSRHRSKSVTTPGSEIQLTSAEQVVSPWDRTAAGPQGNPAVPLASLSRDSMELFTTRVQPLLVNRCGASNCHGGTNNMSFRLIDGRWGNRVPRRITQQNLLATLAQIDAQDPAHSPLLQPHAHLASAGVEEIAFDGTTRGQYELLTRWIEMSLEKPLHHAPAPPQLRQVPTVGTRPNNATPNSATRSPGIEPTRGGETDPFDPAEFERNER